MATHYTQEPRGTRYVFDKAGEGISMHAHIDPRTRHTTECIRGACAVYGDGVDETLRAGTKLAFKSHRAHEIVALEDGTEIFNELEDPGFINEPASGSVAPVLMGRGLFNND